MPHDPGQRLQKALAHLGLGSRREIEAWIRAGRLTVNGAAALLGTRVRDSDRIQLDGRLVRQRPAAAQQVFLCHRSTGEPLEREADASPECQALFERLPRTGGRRFIAVSPMPFHDGGLELVTSDGGIAERLQRAVRRLIGEFRIRLRGELAEPQLASVRSGELDSGHRLEVLDCSPQGGEGANHWYALTARGASGKDVRQLFERSGGIVGRVLRTRLGTIALDRALPRGHFRRLSPQELAALFSEHDAGEARPAPKSGGRGPRPAHDAPRRAQRPPNAARAAATARRRSRR